MARQKPQKLKPVVYKRLLGAVTFGDVLRAVADWSEGRLHQFQNAQDWHLVIAGELIPHRPVIAFAVTRYLGHQPVSNEFSGGMDIECEKMLRKLRFDIEPVDSE